MDIDRNLSDAELDAIRDNRGVAQIVGFGPYLRPFDASMTEDLRATWRKYGPETPQTPSDLLSVNDPATPDWDEDKFWEFLHEFHVVLELDKPSATTRDHADAIDYAVKRIGIDHVGISSDFNHAGGLADWRDVGDNMHVTAELLRRGYYDAQIAKLWGGSFLRVWDGVRSLKTL